MNNWRAAGTITGKTRASFDHRPTDGSRSLHDILRDALPAANIDDDEFATDDAEIEHEIAGKGGSTAERTQRRRHGRDAATERQG